MNGEGDEDGWFDFCMCAGGIHQLGLFNITPDFIYHVTFQSLLTLTLLILTYNI